jgi:hypothetical protein
MSPRPIRGQARRRWRAREPAQKAVENERKNAARGGAPRGAPASRSARSWGALADPARQPAIGRGFWHAPWNGELRVQSPSEEDRSMSRWPRALQTVLTVGYLISALAITIATSSSGSYSPSNSPPANYSVFSNCSGAEPWAAIQVVSGRIVESIDSKNVRGRPSPFTFKSFGFPTDALVPSALRQVKAPGVEPCAASAQNLPADDQPSGPTQTYYVYQCRPAAQPACQIYVKALPAGDLGVAASTEGN